MPAQLAVQLPRSLTARAAEALLRFFGWRVEFARPPAPKAIIIVYPHTSNWDFVIGILARFAMGLPLRYIGKESLFRWPFGVLFRALGGIPVNRSGRNGMVAQIVAQFAERPSLFLALAPEGTRAHTDHLKSGFHSLALAARVPVGLGYIDFGRRVVGIADWVQLTGDRSVDLALLRAFYADKRGRHPTHASDFRFRDGD